MHWLIPRLEQLHAGSAWRTGAAQRESLEAGAVTTSLQYIRVPHVFFFLFSLNLFSPMCFSFQISNSPSSNFAEARDSVSRWFSSCKKLLSPSKKNVVSRFISKNL